MWKKLILMRIGGWNEVIIDTGMRNSEKFCEDFGEWSEEYWKACSPQIRRKLQEMLRRNSVFIQKRIIKAKKALKDLATLENFFPKWTTQEIMHQFLHHGVIDTRNLLILEDREYCRQLWKQGETIFWKETRQQVQFEEKLELEEELNIKEGLKTKVEQMAVKTNRNQNQPLGTS
ncbi:hypothetical protein GcC1_172012 [Golovinomyces cichoracearum]|uniref:Uncharacterized protein n=1 Tax=Golovinomyces cichoracearum TaxID=62708 RepID=A0A420HQV2_9PEZI|nr:hypothetical protein GcC1_172012 [Golovinomyces cichoracearum]